MGAKDFFLFKTGQGLFSKGEKLRRGRIFFNQKMFGSAEADFFAQKVLSSFASMPLSAILKRASSDTKMGVGRLGVKKSFLG